jgi:23S rRNA maturation-related 3'-5' exoribonuclease YhaM
MKTKLICTLFICFIAFTNVYSAQINMFVGDVQGERRGQPFRISVGLALETGDIIRTGSKSKAEIRYVNRTTISMAENTVITIGNINIPASNEPTIVSGRARAVFGRGSQDGRVFTPTTVAAVRGTDFTINVNEGNSVIVLAKGGLDVNNPYSQVSLNAGDNVQANVGEKVERTNRSNKDVNRNMSAILVSNLNRSLESYTSYINDFEQSARTQDSDMKRHSAQIRTAKSAEELRGAERNIDTMEASLRDNLFLTQGTTNSLQLILDSLPDKSSREFAEFSRIKERSNSVAALKARNYAEIQAIKQQHREAVERIRGQFESDRARILEGVQRQRERN